jgi:hypothetical protein
MASWLKCDFAPHVNAGHPNGPAAGRQACFRDRHFASELFLQIDPSPGRLARRWLVSDRARVFERTFGII